MSIKSSIIASIIGLLLIFQNAFATEVFLDVDSGHPHYTAIQYLYENGTIQGYPDHTFRPQQPVNRAEALKVILLGSSILVPEIQSQEIFPDVVHGMWYAKYVAKAKNLKIVSGYGDTGLFRPGNTVNLAEILKMLLETNNININAFIPAKNPYADVPRDAWFAPYFEYAQKAGLVDQKSTGNVNPATPINRAMLAELMYRLATKSKIDTYGKASFYGEKFHGRTTANGEVFDASKLTAAHRTYPFNTWLKVTNTVNDKSVIVRINDRGPYTKDGRIIDLSKAAFEAISPLSRGVIEVTITKTTAPPKEEVEGEASLKSKTKEVDKEDDQKNDEKENQSTISIPLNTKKGNCPDAQALNYLAKNSFENIQLDNEIPNRILQDEILIISGSTTVPTDTVSAFIVDSSDKQTVFSDNVKNDEFTIPLRFSQTGEFKLGVIPGESGRTIVHEIQILPNNCIAEKEDIKLTPPSDLNVNLKEGDTIISWPKNDYNLFQLTIAQGDQYQKYILYDINEWQPHYQDFTDFQEDDVQLSLRRAKLSTKSILEPSSINWSPPIIKKILATTHYEYTINSEEVEIISLPANIKINKKLKVEVKPKTNLRSEGAVILPNGKVEKISLSGSTRDPIKNQNDVTIFPPSSQPLTLSYTPKINDLHFLEINNDAGLAVVNIPIYPNDHFPLLPNAIEKTDRQPIDLGGNLSKLRNNMLQLVNQDRQEHELAKLKSDRNLNNLAQYRADDMVDNQYFGHWDKEGRSANDLRKNYTITQIVAENIAKDVNLELAQYGLMRSAIHRANILSEDWKRVGFGIKKNQDGSYIFVQIFSDDPLDLSSPENLQQEILKSINANRNINLTLQDNLNTLAQSWSVKMVNEDFFGFIDSNDTTLVDTIRTANINSSIGTYIAGNSNFNDAIEQVTENTQIQEPQWRNIGIGIDQDSFGIIKITLIYTE